MSGHLPFPPARTPAEQQTLALAQPPDLWGVNWAGAILAECLDKDPSRRPAAEQVVERLVSLIDEASFGSRVSLFDTRRQDVMERESITVVTDIEATADGRLQVRVVVPEMLEAKRVRHRFRSNSGDTEFRIGDLVSIGWQNDTILHVGELLASLRTGDEVAPTLPTRCDTCGEHLAPDSDSGGVMRCLNDRYCPTLVLPRIESNLRLASKMRRRPADHRRSVGIRQVAALLLKDGLIRNEGDLYAREDGVLSAALADRVPPEFVDWFLEDRAQSRLRPFAATVSTLGRRVDDRDASRIVDAFPTLRELSAATEDALAQGLTGRRMSEAMRSRLDKDEGREQRRLELALDKAAQLRAWLSVPWHMEALGQMEAAGVTMRREPEDRWPPKSARRAGTRGTGPE